jgi:hypothetical protein
LCLIIIARESLRVKKVLVLAIPMQKTLLLAVTSYATKGAAALPPYNPQSMGSKATDNTLVADIPQTSPAERNRSRQILASKAAGNTVADNSDKAAAERVGALQVASSATI